MKAHTKPTLSILIPSLLLALGLTTGAALAEPHGQGFGGRHQGPDVDRLVERLDLSPDQGDALTALFAERRDGMQASREQMRAARQALTEQIHAESFDERAIREAAAAVTVLETEHAVERGRFVQEVRNILTPEQFDEFRQMRQDRRERLDRGGQGRGRGQAPRRGYGTD